MKRQQVFNFHTASWLGNERDDAAEYSIRTWYRDLVLQTLYIKRSATTRRTELLSFAHDWRYVEQNTTFICKLLFYNRNFESNEDGDVQKKRLFIDPPNYVCHTLTLCDYALFMRTEI